MEAPKPIAITTPAALPKTHEQQPRADALPISAQPSRQSGRGSPPSLFTSNTPRNSNPKSPSNLANHISQQARWWSVYPVLKDLGVPVKLEKHPKAKLHHKVG